ncbi:hypothetical protein BJ508DRAFT_197606, partial [Ascobolus immersus RN42]
PTGKCSFYADCLEAKKKCGSSGYALDYGKKYCNKFENAKSKFTTSGQRWVTKTMTCLQKKLVPAVKGTSGWTTCDAIEKKAFASHSDCYVSSGLCDLDPKDWAQIFLTVGAGGMFGGIKNLVEVVQTADACFPLVMWIV